MINSLSDISLVTQVVVLHNKSAFDQLVRKYQSQVRRFFLNQTCGDKELSDDLAQDTFIKAYTKALKDQQIFQLGSTELHIMFFLIIFAVRNLHLIWKW